MRLRLACTWYGDMVLLRVEVAMAPCSIDLRTRVLRTRDAEDVAAPFAVSRAWGHRGCNGGGKEDHALAANQVSLAGASRPGRGLADAHCGDARM